MSQENRAVVRGLLAHGATRFALLLSLLAFGALGAVACDDDESATAETEVITSDFAQGSPGRGRAVVAGGSDACGDYRRRPGAMVVRIEVLQGVVRCREARRVLKNFYPHGRSTPPWSCVDYGVELVQCRQPEGAFRGIVGCSVARSTEVRAACPPGFELPALATPDPRGAELYPVPARKSCGHSRIAPPGDHPLILVEVVFGRVPCRVARRVLTTQKRSGHASPGSRRCRRGTSRSCVRCSKRLLTGASESDHPWVRSSVESPSLFPLWSSGVSAQSDCAHRTGRRASCLSAWAPRPA
jgi:hypothetical protein